MSAPALSARVASLRALIDEIAAPGWTRRPLWWALLGGVAVAEPFGRPGAYVVSDAEPRADTCMAVPGAAAVDAAGRVGWAIAAAHAAVRAVLARDGSLPDQPLTVAIALHRGAARTVAVASPWRVAFAAGGRLVTARLDPRGPGHEHALARALAAALRGAPVPAADPIEAIAAGADAGRPTPLLAVTLGDDELARAHHGHRRAWHAGGGPWLGVARAGGQTVLSTCHLVVDGWGHALLAADLARGLDRGAARALAATAAAVVGNGPLAAAPPLPATAGGGLGVAWRRLPGPAPRFARQAWALGRVLHHDRGQPAAARSPTFQVPVAPGASDDPRRFARRVRPAILNVRFSDERPEPLAVFAARARAAIAGEAAGHGLSARLLAALSALPAPLGWKRGVVGVRAPWLGELVEVLAGAGCLSLLRVPGAPPLVAISSPALLAAADAPRATSVLTVVDDGDGVTATLAGSGRARDPAEAGRLLDAWCAIVAGIEAGDAAASGAS
ncbi:MAG: hypothetical protein KJZ91_09310 [Myxococcales bacterium]|nr:hypothetical protein [Myxococcales bacterium]